MNLERTLEDANRLTSKVMTLVHSIYDFRWEERQGHPEGWTKELHEKHRGRVGKMRDAVFKLLIEIEEIQDIEFPVEDYEPGVRLSHAAIEKLTPEERALLDKVLEGDEG